MAAVTSRTRTITVRLPEALADEIETESRKRGVSKSDVVRERLESARAEAELPAQLEDIADLIGSIDDDLPADLSARTKHYLRCMALAATVLVDTGFLAALFRRRDTHRAWAVRQAAEVRRPWHCCEAVLAEAFFLLGTPGRSVLSTLLRRRSLQVSFSFADHQEPVLELMDKYADVPMSLADACLVRMTEVLPEPVVLTTVTDFRVYRRHGRQVIPCVAPP